MKNKVLIGGLTAALIATTAAACASPGTANKTTTNTTTTTSSTTSRTTPTNTNTAATSNTAPTNTADSTASSQGKQDFTLVNRTGVEIHELHVSPHDQDEWGEDILGRDTLADGGTVEIVFSPKEKAALWDLKITDSKGNSIEWESLNLMEISTVMLRYDDGKATAEVQ